MKPTLIIAGPCPGRLASWKQGLDGFACTTYVTDGLGTLGNQVARIKPSALLLDLDLAGAHEKAGLGGLCAASKTIIAGDTISGEMEWEFLKAGVRGCCQSDTSPDLLRQIVDAVLQGELWIRRSLTSRLIHELGETTATFKAHRPLPDILAKLTQRELDIAARVRNGESNKQIAKSCSITERTVKAHLTEIFIKTGVTGRLNLALAMSANDRHRTHGAPQTTQ